MGLLGDLHGAWFRGLEYHPTHGWSGFFGQYCPCMVVLQAEEASQDRVGPASECLAEEAWVKSRPIEVLSCKGLPAVLAIIGDPPSHFIIPLCPDYCPPGRQIVQGLYVGTSMSEWLPSSRTSPPIGRCLSQVVYPGVAAGLVPAQAQGPPSPLTFPCIPGHGSFSPPSRVRMPED